ncbi:hypothetical protein JCM10908_004208 [Rhodotorula pacifica]|uniref:SLC41A family transporter n=1 Tax=Rhodotorula pacifica TaxID=1495444 RepID=UPI00317B21AD
MAATRAALEGYELAEQSTDGERRNNHDRPPKKEPGPRVLDDDDGLSDDDEIEQLLSSRGHGRLSADDDRTDDGKEDVLAGGASSDDMVAQSRDSVGGNSKEKRTLLTRITGGMTARQRRTFASEMLRETLPVLLLTLLTSILTGELLQRVQTWRVFIRIEELFILVPILLNLKGNLEMNLAARFSTSANIGELDLRLTRRSLVLGNLALLQVQALIVSLLSGLLAFLLGLASRKGVHHALQHPVHNGASPENAAAGGLDATAALRGGYFEALLVLCVSMLAAGLSSGVLGSFMCSLVVLCRRFRLNPDNIATPLASSLGDLITLLMLGGLSSLFLLFMGTIVSTLVFVALLGTVAFNIVVAFRNPYVQELLTMGWTPLFAAMAISSGSGVVLETYVTRYPGYALLAPVITAITGSAGSIFVSRISTALHSGRREHYFVTSLSLWLMTCPVVMAFLGFTIVTGQLEGKTSFVLAFFVAIGIQTALGLVLAHQGSLLLWKLDYDPDVYALPLLSAFLDVSGQLLLVAAYVLSGIKSGDSPTSAIDSSAGANATPAVADVVTTALESAGDAIRRRWTYG